MKVLKCVLLIIVASLIVVNMATLASWQNSLFIQQVLHPEARMDFDDNATGLQGGGLNDSFLGLICTYPEISIPSMLISNAKTTGLSEYSIDDSIASIQNPVTASFSSLMDPYSFTLYVKGLLQSNTIESGTFTAPAYTDPNPWLHYSLLKPMNNSNVIGVDRESFEYWGAIPKSLSINGATGDVMRVSVEYLALRTDRTNVIGRISNEPRLIYRAGDVGNVPSGIGIYREPTYNSYTLLDSSPTYVSNDSNFTTPKHLLAGSIEISNSTGHFNFSQDDIDSYENQNIIVYYSKSERQEYYKDKRIGFAEDVVPFKFQDLVASINGEAIELTKIGLNIRNNISANYYDRQGGYKWVLGKLTGTVNLHINWGDSVVGGAEGVYEYFKDSHHALSFYWGSSSPNQEGEAKISFDGKIKSITVNESKGELHSDVVFEIAKNVNSFEIKVGIDEDKLQSTTTSTTSTSTTSTSTTSTSTSVTGTSSTSTTSTSTTSTSSSSTSTSTTTSTSTSSSTSSTSTTTTLPSLVETDIGAAGDYTTVAAWVAGEQGDFVGNGQIHKGNLIDANLNVTSTISITGATTGPNNYWWLTSDSATRRHTGGEGTGASLTASSDIGAAALLQSDDDVRIDFIEIDCNSNAEIGIRVYGGSLWMLIDGNIIHGVGTSSTPTVGGIGVTVEGAGNDITIRNNSIYDITDVNGTGDAYGIYIVNTDQTTIYIHNNSLHEIGDSGDSDCYGIYTNTFTGVGECINNIVIDVLGTATSLCFANLGINTVSGLVSSDITAVGPNNRVNETIAGIYANATARDYHLMNGSYALNNGTNLSGYFTYDYEEDTRPYNSGAWDIGCDEGTPYLTSTSTSTTSTSTTSTSSSTTSTSSTSTSTSSTSTSSTSTSTSTSSTSTTSTTTSTTSTSTSSTSTTSTSSSTTSTTTTPTWTVVESTIGTAGDYTTIAAWVSAKAGDFVADNEQHKGILIDNKNYDQTSTLTITGATADKTRNWWLTSDPSVRHTGKEGTGARIRSTSNDVTLINIEDDFIIEYIELDGNADSYITFYGLNVDSPNYCKINSCIIHNIKGGGANFGVGTTGNGIDLDIWNNLIYGVYGDGVGGSIYGIAIWAGENLINMYNNTIDDIGGYEEGAAYGIGINSFLTWGYNRNNIVTRVTGATANCFFNSGGWTNSHNISSDDTAPGSDYLRDRNAFGLFANPIGRDYHLVTGSVALDSGWDGISYFANDIDGESRPYGVVWDRGCDESTTVITSTSTSSTSTSSTSSTTVTLTSTSTTSTSTTSTSSTSTSSTSTSSTSTSSSTTSTSISTSTSSTSTTSTSTSSTSTTTTPTWTIVESTIGTAGDYTTIAAWISNQQGDFVSDNEVHKGILIDNTNYNITSIITITGATTDKTRNWWLTSDPSVRHTGIAGTGARIRANAYIVQMIRLEDHSIIDYIEFDGNRSSNPILGLNIAESPYAKIDSCIFHNLGGFSYNSAIVSFGPDFDIDLWNNLIYDIRGDGIGGDVYGMDLAQAQGGNLTVFNNTIDDLGQVGDGIINGMSFNGFSIWGYNRNNIITRLVGTTTACFNGFAGWTNSHNMSSDNTAPGPNYLRGRDDPYIIYADHNNRDYHLVDGSVALNSGTGLSTYFTHDIDGDIRPYDSGVWDRGCDEGTPFVTSTSTSSSTTSTSTTSTSTSSTTTSMTSTSTTSTSTSITTTSTTSTSTSSTSTTSTTTSTTSSTSTSTTLIPDDPEWIERHENSSGFDNPDDWSDTFDDPDSNYLTSSVIGAPVDWGNECCQYVNQEREWPSYFSYTAPTPPAIGWLKWEFIIESESLSDTESLILWTIASSGLGNIAYIKLYQDGSGNLRIRADVFHDGSSNSYYSLNSQFLSLDTPYRLEFKWDATNYKWAWKLDGINQPNDQDSTSPVILDGLLTGSHETDISTGTTGAPTGTVTFYLDNIASDTNGWIGDKGVGTTTSTSSTSTSTSSSTTSTTTTI